MSSTKKPAKLANVARSSTKPGRTRPPSERTLARSHSGKSEDAAALFSAGSITRKEAMRALDLSYGELLDRLAEQSLPLPRVSEGAANEMAISLGRLLDDAAR